MHTVRLAILLLCLWLGACQSLPPAAPVSNLVVVLEDPISVAAPTSLTATPVEADMHAVAMTVAKTYDLNVVGDWAINEIGLYCFEITAPDPDSLAQLRADPRVLWVERATPLHLQMSDLSATPDTLVHSFMEEVEQRGEHRIVAVVDTDVDGSHPALQHAELRVHNFAGQRGMPMAEHHGTAVVGLISAQPNATQSMTGIANAAEVHLLRACWEQEPGQGICSTRTLSEALNAAIALRPDVLNLSLTGNANRLLQRLIEALTQNGTLVVAAYDERRPPAQRFPAPTPGVIYAVGSPMPGATANNVITVNAPRAAISIAPQASYDIVTGHSIAAPVVSAMAACLMARHPDASPDQIIELLRAWSNRFSR